MSDETKAAPEPRCRHGCPHVECPVCWDWPQPPPGATGPRPPTARAAAPPPEALTCTTCGQDLGGWSTCSNLDCDTNKAAPPPPVASGEAPAPLRGTIDGRSGDVLRVKLADGAGAIRVNTYMHGEAVEVRPIVAAPAPGGEVSPLTTWTDSEVAVALLARLWRWMDAGGKSHGRSYDAEMLEAARELLPMHKGAWHDHCPDDNALLDETRRRTLARPPRLFDEVPPDDPAPGELNPVTNAPSPELPAIATLRDHLESYERGTCDVANLVDAVRAVVRADPE